MMNPFDGLPVVPHLSEAGINNFLSAAGTPMREITPRTETPAACLDSISSRRPHKRQFVRRSFRQAVHDRRRPSEQRQDGRDGHVVRRIDVVLVRYTLGAGPQGGDQSAASSPSPVVNSWLPLIYTLETEAMQELPAWPSEIRYTGVLFCGHQPDGRRTRGPHPPVGPLADAQFVVPSPFQSAIRNPYFASTHAQQAGRLNVFAGRRPLFNPQSSIRNLQSAICNLQSVGRPPFNPQFAILNPQSAILNQSLSLPSSAARNIGSSWTWMASSWMIS
jgi:hypothetical protein